MPSIFLTIIISLLIFLVYKKYSFMGIVGIILSFWIIFNNLILIFKKIIIKNKLKKIFPMTKSNYSIPMIISHLGIGLLILGITGSSVWQDEKIVRMKINNNVNIKEYNIVFNKIEEITEKNYVAIRGNFLAYDNEKNIIANLKPENRFYTITKNITTEASIHTNLLRDLYIVLGDGNLKDGWIIRVYYNPLVMWIWIGSLFIFIGGIVSIIKNLSKIKYLV